MKTGEQYDGRFFAFSKCREVSVSSWIKKEFRMTCRFIPEQLAQLFALDFYA